MAYPICDIYINCTENLIKINWIYLKTSYLHFHLIYLFKTIPLAHFYLQHMLYNVYNILKLFNFRPSFSSFFWILYKALYNSIRLNLLPQMYKITCTNTSGLGLYKNKDEKLDNRFNKKRVGCILYTKIFKIFFTFKEKVLHVLQWIFPLPFFFVGNFNLF